LDVVVLAARRRPPARAITSIANPAEIGRTILGTALE